MAGPRLMGLALAGGKSDRMGENKALIRPFQNASLLERAFALLSGLAPFCFVSSATGARYDGFPCLEDAPGPAGPCRGILAGLNKAADLGLDGILCVACDIPAISASLLAILIRKYAAAPQNFAVLYQCAATGRVEMLAGVYSTKFLATLKSGMENGQHSLYWLLPRDKCLQVPYGPELSPFFMNCNRPEDLAGLSERDFLSPY